MMKTSLNVAILCSASLLALSACKSLPGGDNSALEAAEAAAPAFDGTALATVVDGRSDEEKARDEWRNPGETLAFFGVTPDMTVVETLPGGGWYSRILVPYLDDAGEYAAANYSVEMFEKVLPNPSEETMNRIRGWAAGFPDQAAMWGATGDVTAFHFGEMRDEMKEKADAVLMIRALHNFNRAGGDYGAVALAETYAMLKPGGVLGVVQHRANPDAEGADADGSLGYMSEEAVVAMVEAAGFVLEEKSDINANPADNPASGEFVWRLPPSFAMGDQNRDAFAAIGETDRMTMRFRKPAE
ncbi:MAG: methyltransferase [Pseudomonadota bacterium]